MARIMLAPLRDVDLSELSSRTRLTPAARLPRREPGRR
jgi:hypothetical protein